MFLNLLIAAVVRELFTTGIAPWGTGILLYGHVWILATKPQDF